MNFFSAYLKITFLGLFLGLAVVLITVAVKILIAAYRVNSLLVYCGIDMIEVLKAEPEKLGRMVFEKLIEKGNLLVYKNDNLKKRMRTVGINEEADDYGFDVIKKQVFAKKFPETESVEMFNMEIIDFYFADLSKKNSRIKELYAELQQFKKEVERYIKMVRRYSSI